MLIRIIAQYLESHRRLIIPQMGAFIVKEPGSSVLFSELLKRDDGALRALLVAEGIPELEAAGEIDRFVFEVRHAVQQGREFPLAGLGVLKPGPNGTIAFAYDPQIGEAATPASAPAAQSGAAQFGATQPAAAWTAPAAPTRPAEPAPAAASAPLRPAASAASAAPARPAAPVAATAPEESEASRKLASAVQNLYGDSAQPARPVRSAQPAQSVRPTQPASRPAQPQSESSELPRSDSAPKSRFQLASKKLKRDELFADSYYGRLPRRPAIEQTVRVKKRSDHFIWIALIAAIIALAAIFFGQWCESFGSEGEEVFFEQPADDMQAF